MFIYKREAKISDYFQVYFQIISPEFEFLFFLYLDPQYVY